MKIRETRPDPTAGVVAVLLDRLSEIQAIYLFGSRVEGKTHPGSDLDLAVLADGDLPPTRLWETAQHLASHIGMDVDLVNLGKASTVMQMQVIQDGKRLYCANEKTCDTFEDRVFSSYARLNEERSEILRDVAQRGNIHG